MTADEWKYVFETRETNSGIRFAKAKVNGVNGVILLPDNWNSSYYSLKKTNDRYARYKSNKIKETDWKNCLESNGAVFLPSAGERVGNSVFDIKSDGEYWSTTYSTRLFFTGGSLFDSGYLYIYKLHYPDFGRSVRLVTDVK